MPNPILETITLPSGTLYDIADKYAREAIEDLSKYTQYLGVTTTALEDGSSTNPIMINGEYVTAVNGNIVTYQQKEFIFNGTVWQEFGDLSGLGALAYKDSATGSYTPEGSVTAPSISSSDSESGNYQPKGVVSTPTITVNTAGSTSVVKNPTAKSVVTSLASAAPGASAPSNPLTYYAVEGTNLKLYQIGASKEDSITTENVTVKTGDASYSSSQPTFTGTKAQLTVSQPTFSGTAKNVTVS